jgi:hypothetical protein
MYSLEEWGRKRVRSKTRVEDEDGRDEPNAGMTING